MSLASLKEKELCGFPFPYWIVVLSTFIDSFGGYLLFPFFGYFITAKYNVSFTEIGLLFTSFSIGGIVGGMIGGAIADKLGRKPVALFGLIVSAIGGLGMYFIETLYWFYALAIITGFLGSVGGPARGALVTDLLPTIEKRTEGFGIFRIVFNISAMLGPILGGFVSARSGSYLPLFILDAVASLITAILFLVFIPETKPESGSTSAKEKVQEIVVETPVSSSLKKNGFLETLKGYGKVFKDTPFILYVVVVALMSLVYMQLNSTLSVFLLTEHDFPPNYFGYLISINAGFVIVFQWLISRAIRKFPPMIMIGIGTALYAIGFGMFGFVSTTWMFIVAILILTVGECVVAPHQMGLVGLFAPEDMRGRYMAVSGFSGRIPSLFGIVLAGWIMDTISPSSIWYFIFGVGMIAMLGFFRLHKLTKIRFAEARQQDKERQQQKEQQEPKSDIKIGTDIIEIQIDQSTEIIATSEELPELEVKS